MFSTNFNFSVNPEVKKISNAWLWSQVGWVHTQIEGIAPKLRSSVHNLRICQGMDQVWVT